MNRYIRGAARGVGLIGLLGLSTYCSSHAAPRASTGTDAFSAATPVKSGPTPTKRNRRANVVFVLADDLAWNLVEHMPNVLEMQKRGTTFSRYFVTDSLCCPSRSSILTGKFPHDTQVFTNSGPLGGYATFERAGNAPQTFGAALHDAGYKTGFMGKYLNGYHPAANQADPGWSAWDVAGDGYPEFDYELNQDGSLVSYGHAAADYLTDVLSGLATSFVRDAGSDPYLLEVATFAPHAPYVPAPRYAGTLDVKVPRTPAFDRANTAPPRWLAAWPPLTQAEIDKLDREFDLRAEAVRAIDDMIGALLSTVGSDTYVVFSSDNGYHMGEHMLLAGKQTAFDTDIRVPLVVVGPGVPAGAVVDRVVENIDLCPTFAELGGAPAPPTADGRSLVPFLEGQSVSDWRNVALVEHRGPDVAPKTADDPDNEPRKGPEPNSYEAIRMENAVYVEYLDGETEYYDLTTDPDEMVNTASSLAPNRVRELHDTIGAIQSCHGADACWKAQQMP